MTPNDDLSLQVVALRERLSRLNEANLRINESLDFDSVLQLVVDSACELTGARYGAVVPFNDSGRVEGIVTCGFTPEPTRGRVTPSFGHEYIERVFETQEPGAVSDLLSHARLIMMSLGIPGDLDQSDSAGLISPLHHRRRHVGTFYLAGKEDGDEFTGEDEETMGMFASQAALVIANARTHREERRARNDLETLVNTSPVGVLVFDPRAGTVTSVNREARRIVSRLHGPDRRAEDLLGELVFRRSDGREVTLEEFPLAGDLDMGETVRAEEIVIAVPDGRSVTTLVNATPILSEEGEVESMVVTVQDMTSLQELDRLRAEFLAMVSHELRAPLTSIKGAAATVIGGTTTFGPAEMVQFFRIIDRQADQMSGLINDLLDVARIETGTLPVNPEPVLVAALVDQARAAFQSGGSRHDIRIDLPPDLPRVMADPRRIVQVLGNLLSNAARHSPESVPIRVVVVQEEFHVSVSVEDQGSGLPADSLSFIFRKFSRFESEDRVGDTGLGLAISRGIVEAHGGRIWAESDGPGRGARFTFTVPVVEEAAPGAVTVPARPAAGSRRPAREQVRILAVDDDPQALRYVHDTLNRAGYAPMVTGDPDEALSFMEVSEPHLALLDLVLPGSDGIELMKDIRAIANIPVIFLSAYGQEDVVASAFDMGADDYVVKPFSPTELEARIRAALRRWAAFGQSEPSEPYVRGDLVIDYDARSVSVAGRPVRLTAIEYRLLVALSANAGMTMTYEQLLERVWDRRSDGDLRPMRSAVRSLRRKLGDDADSPTYIFTETRVGYRMAKRETEGPETG